MLSQCPDGFERMVFLSVLALNVAPSVREERAASGRTEAGSQAKAANRSRLTRRYPNFKKIQTSGSLPPVTMTFSSKFFNLATIILILRLDFHQVTPR